MTALPIPLNLAYQCKWCNEDDLWIGHNCRECGSKTGKCRSPKWDRIRATVASVDNPAFTTQMFFVGAASQCCGIGWATNGNNAFPANGTDFFTNPFAQTGVRCRYRSYAENTSEYRKLCLQPTPPHPTFMLYSATSCGHWTYNLHWHYLSRLNAPQIYISRLANDDCKWRVTLRVSGVHFLAHTFQYLDPLPPGNCAGQYFLNGVYSGIKSVTIFNPSACNPDPCAALPNANCAMPDFLPIVSPTIINLPGQFPFSYWMTRDVDELTDVALAFNRTLNPGVAHCNQTPINTIPSITGVECPSPVNRTFPGNPNFTGGGNLCEDCSFQGRYAGGFETFEVITNPYNFTQAIWDAWNVTFSFL